VERPSAEEVRAAYGRTIPDTIGPGLRLLLVGINPGLYSGATGHHFARPGNRFWKTLHAAGLTDRVLEPDETAALIEAGLGITNLVARTTARADELRAEELRAGTKRLEGLVRRRKPRKVAILGVTAYRTAFGRPKAAIGRQPEDLAGAELWVMPNPSGLNAHYQLPELAELFAQLASSS
jgi:TDG/mug DNA glycosylase family protein